jgi:hypothetical protein
VTVGKLPNRLKGEFVIEAVREAANQYRVALIFRLPDGGAVRLEHTAQAPDVALRSISTRQIEAFLDSTTRHSQAFKQLVMRVFGGIPDPEDAPPAVAQPSPDGTAPTVASNAPGGASSGPVRSIKQQAAAAAMKAKWAAKRAAKQEKGSADGTDSAT